MGSLRSLSAENDADRQQVHRTASVADVPELCTGRKLNGVVCILTCPFFALTSLCTCRMFWSVSACSLVVVAAEPVVPCEASTRMQSRSAVLRSQSYPWIKLRQCMVTYQCNITALGMTAWSSKHNTCLA